MLYKKAQEDGDAVRQIKSLAKANNVKATVIKNILVEAGLNVPDHIPTGPMKKSPTVIEAADPVPGEAGYRKPATINQDFENEVKKMVEESKRVAMPDVSKEAEVEFDEAAKNLEDLNKKKSSIEEYMKRGIT